MQPWIDEQTERVEIAFIMFNPVYGEHSVVWHSPNILLISEFIFVSVLPRWEKLSSPPWHVFYGIGTNPTQDNDHSERQRTETTLRCDVL